MFSHTVILQIRYRTVCKILIPLSTKSYMIYETAVLMKIYPRFHSAYFHPSVSSFKRAKGVNELAVTQNNSLHT